jgi:hypothetical protein
MSLMASTMTSQSRVIVLAGIAMAVVGAGAGVLRSDLLLNRGFGNALEATRPGLSFDGATAKAQDHAAVGDEGYWLTRSEVESPAPFAKQLAVGDRISIAGRDGRERQLEVVDLKAIGGNAVRPLRTGGMRLLLVTCRVTGEASDRADAPVRFVIEAEPMQRALAAPAKAL